MSGRSFAARSPVTRATASTYEELIEAEYLTAAGFAPHVIPRGQTMIGRWS